MDEDDGEEENEEEADAGLEHVGGAGRGQQGAAESFDDGKSERLLYDQFLGHSIHPAEGSGDARQPLRCFFAAFSLPFHCLATVFSLPSYCLVTALSLPSHCLLTAFSLPCRCLSPPSYCHLRSAPSQE